MITVWCNRSVVYMLLCNQFTLYKLKMQHVAYFKLMQCHILVIPQVRKKLFLKVY